MSHVFAEIANERAAQDAKWGGPKHDDKHTLAEWIAFVSRHNGLAVDDGTANCDERFRKQMIRVAALAVAAVESIDRRKPLLGKKVGHIPSEEGRKEVEPVKLQAGSIASTVKPGEEVTDRSDPRLREIKDNGQQAAYLVLSAEERAKGFVRPVRQAYIHKLCRAQTTMSLSIAETYARKPDFYSGTFCCHCRKHFDLVNPDGTRAFQWAGTTPGMPGSDVGE